VIQGDFFTRFNIDPLSFDRSGLKWEDLLRISEDYSEKIAELKTEAQRIVEKILTFSSIHSINYRIKDNEHLIEKIIRKVIANPARKITLENYQEEITDLIGIRALHLFKEDWIHIHSFLTENWNFKEQPIAYVRNGDAQRILTYYQENNCRIEIHPYGYRSVHYVVSENTGRKYHYSEIQVRTLFEEAWGEIDHGVRYPYFQDNDLLLRLSSILNRLSGNADELGTYMRYLKDKTEITEKNHTREIAEKNALIDSLRRKVYELAIDKEQKSAIASTLDDLKEEEKQGITVEENFPWLDSLIESPLFHNITSQLEKLVSSNQIKPIDISEDEMKMVQNAREELMKLLGDPVKLQKFLNDDHTRKLIGNIEDS